MRALTKLMVAVALLAGLLGDVQLAAAGAPFAPKPGQGTFLILSDIHFDPFAAPGLAAALYDAPIETWPKILERRSPEAFSPYGQDSDYALFKSSLDAAKALQPNYDFVLLLGDLLSHDFQQKGEEALGSRKAARQFSILTSQFVAQEVQRRFGKAPVVPAIGNNDDECGDYAIEPDGGYLRKLAQTWDLLRQDPAAQRDFIKLGSFSVTNPVVAHHRILSLNTVFFSRSYTDTCRPTDADPGAALLDWLEAQLKDAAAAGDVVTLVMHIPPGFDGYASYSAGACTATPLWLAPYQARFRKLATKYRDILSLGFAGHVHMDQFRVFGTPADGFLPIHVVPSISPVYDNNPGFTVFLYNRATGTSVDYAVQYTQLNDAPPNPAWQPEYKWSKAFGYGRVDAKRLWALDREIQPDQPFAQKFKAYFQVRSGKPIKPELWQSYLCALTSETAADFSACRCPAD